MRKKLLTSLVELVFELLVGKVVFHSLMPIRNHDLPSFKLLNGILVVQGADHKFFLGELGKKVETFLVRFSFIINQEMNFSDRLYSRKFSHRLKKLISIWISDIVGFLTKDFSHFC